MTKTERILFETIFDCLEVTFGLAASGHATPAAIAGVKSTIGKMRAIVHETALENERPTVPLNVLAARVSPKEQSNV
jgi:hypothetical protein